MQKSLREQINWIALGDSITQGYYSLLTDEGNGTYKLDKTKGWVSYVQKLKGYNLTNKAVGGTGYVRSHDDKEDNAVSIIKNINFLDFDLCTIAYGVNDWKYNQKLGSFNDDIEIGGTFYSNMRKTIEYILQSNPNIKIIVITPLNCLYGTKENNWGLGYPFSNNGTLEDIFNAMIEVCDYYSIEYIDMTHYSVINRQNISALLLDKVHPSEEAHKKIGYELANRINF